MQRKPCACPRRLLSVHPRCNSAAHQMLFTFQSSGRAFSPLFKKAHGFFSFFLGSTSPQRASKIAKKKKKEKQFSIDTHPSTPAATSLVLIDKRHLKDQEEPCGSRPKARQLGILSQTARDDRGRGYNPRQPWSDLCPSSSFPSPRCFHTAAAKSHPQSSPNRPCPSWKSFQFLSSAKPCSNEIHHQTTCQLKKPFVVLSSRCPRRGGRSRHRCSARPTLSKATHLLRAAPARLPPPREGAALLRGHVARRGGRRGCGGLQAAHAPAFIANRPCQPGRAAQLPNGQRFGTEIKGN